MHAACPTHFILYDLTVLVFDKKY